MTSEAIALEAEVLQPQAPGLLEQVSRVYTDPAALFDQLRKTPRWVGAFLLFLAVNLAVALLWTRNLDLDGYLVSLFNKATLPPGTNVDQILSIQKSVFIPVNIAGALFGVPVFIFFMAFLFWLVGKVAAVEAPAFTQALSAWVVPMLVGLPKTALILIMCVAKRDFVVVPERLAPTSLGFFFHSANPKLQTFLYAMDPFTIAQACLVFLALRRVLGYKLVPTWIFVLLLYLAPLVFSIVKAV